MLRDEFDAVFMGALGDPRIPDMRHARDILLGTRFELDLYVNHRPVKLLDARLCPLKNCGPMRWTSSYSGRIPKGCTSGSAVASKPARTMRSPFRKTSTPTRACSESSSMPSSSQPRPDAGGSHGGQEQRADTWACALAAGFGELTPQYPSIEARHLFIDALAMQMIKNPAQFDVIVTNNMFGDIVTDLGAQLQGGLGMAASGNLHPGRTSMFEPVHGSAPKYAGKNVANPTGAILSAALMLEHLGLSAEAAAVEDAVARAVRGGHGPGEIGGTLGTRETGDYIAGEIRATVPHS